MEDEWIRNININKRPSKNAKDRILKYISWLGIKSLIGLKKWMMHVVEIKLGHLNDKSKSIRHWTTSIPKTYDNKNVKSALVGLLSEN